MNFRKTVLENGLRIITVPQKESLAVTVLVLVEAGSKYESKEQQGLSHFLEHMCFKGTEKRPKSINIAGELDGIGASYNAFTSLEYTGYYAKAEASKFDNVFDIVTDVYLNPVFDANEIDKEKGVIIEEINMYEDDPRHKAGELFMELLYGDQPAGVPIAGPKENIPKLKREDFIKYRRENYLPSATTVVIAGSFEEEDAINKIKNVFGGIKSDVKSDKIKIVESQNKPASFIKHKDSDQMHIVLGVRAYDLFDKRRDALEVMAHLLGGGMSSRLFQKLRDELGLAYYVYADADLYTDHGFLAVAAGVDKNKGADVIKVVLEEFKKLKTELVLDEELDRVKNHLCGGLVLGLETSSQLASFYGGQEIIEKHVLTPEEAIERVRAVSKEDIMEVAKDVFKNEKLNLVVLGPIKDSEKLQHLLDLD